MLSKLGLCYKNTGMDLVLLHGHESRLGPLLGSYPFLQKYLRYEHKDPIRGTPYFSSVTDDYDKGCIYLSEEDSDAAWDAFLNAGKIIKVSDFRLRFDGIDWFGTGESHICAPPRERYEKLGRVFEDEVLCDGIKLKREFAGGMNRVQVTIDCTSDSEPRAGSEIVKKLIPYFGEPFRYKRKCMFSGNEYLKNAELEKKYIKMINELFAAEVSELRHSETKLIRLDNGTKLLLTGEKIKGICDRSSVNKAFKPYGMQVTESRRTGENIISFTDSHGFKTEFMFFRKRSAANAFAFLISVSSCNFDLNINKTRQKDFSVYTKAEADEKLSEIAAFCAKTMPEAAEKMAADFGCCPDWYYDEPGVPIRDLR